MNQKGDVLSENNKYNESKGFAPILILLGIVLLLGVAGGAFYVGKIVSTPPEIYPAPSPSLPLSASTLTPTSNPTIDETVNWKTFTNAKYTIKYPSTYKVVEEKETVVITPNIGNINDPFYSPIAITLLNNQNNLSLRDWFNAKYDNSENIIKGMQDILVDKRKAVTFKDELSVEHVLIADANTIISISPQDAQKNIDNQNKMIDLYLSTFKFNN